MDRGKVTQLPVAIKVVPLMVNDESYDAKSLLALRQEVQVWRDSLEVWISPYLACTALSFQAQAALLSRLKVLSRLRHPHIISFLGAYLSPPNVCIVEQLASGGSLHSRLHSRDRRGVKVHPPLTLAQVLRVGLDVASAMAYLHPNYVHRDLKPQNILLDG